MKFQLVSDKNRKVSINFSLIDIYTSRYKPGTPFEFECVRRVSRKSDPMRKWYWGSVLPILLEGLGYEPEEDELVHRHLKITFFRIKPDSRGIYREKDIPSVFSNESELDIIEKKRFLEWVIRKGAEYGVYIPTPEEN